MAEEEGNTDQEQEFEPDETHHDMEKQARKKQNKEKSTTNKCRSRIEQLALPARRLILDLYQNHAYHLEKEKVEKIKILLQELYAMTPGETERYFSHLREKSENSSRKKDMKFMLKKLVRTRNRERKQKQAYNFIFNLLKNGMKFAVNNPIPPLVSIRLRNLADLVLEQLCDLRDVDIPSREHPGQVGSFFIAVADWFAIVIEYLYFEAQLKKNKELEYIENEYDEKQKEKKVSEGESKGDKRGDPGEKEAVGKPLTDEEGVVSEPLLLSEME